MHHRLMDLSDLNREVSLYGGQWFTQKLTADQSPENRYQGSGQLQMVHLCQHPVC